MSAAVAPVALPPTIGEQHVGLQLFCPMLGTRLTVFLTDADIAVDAVQLVAAFGISDPQTYSRFPVQWVHEWMPARGREPVTLYLWRREDAIAAVVTLSPQSELAEAFATWLEIQHRDFYRDFEETLALCVPSVRSAGASTEYSVAAAAARLAARFGGRVTRSFLFQRMEALGWIERDREAAQLGNWKVTLETRARREPPVYSRTVKIPGGSYEQVFINDAGLELLASDVRAQLQPGLFEGASA
ncbi:hypothetical protein ACWGOE_07390 [Leucobacter chromiiresistens]